MIVFCLLGYKDMLKESKYERVTQWHARKVGKFLRGEWPKPMPEIVMFERSEYDSGNHSKNSVGVE